MASDEFITLSYQEGFANADQFFDRFGEEVVAKVQEAIDSGADEVVSLAQALAPVRTGALRDSIHKEEGGPLSVTVIADAPYAIYVEYGTTFAAAQPFLTPAADVTRPRIVNGIVNALREAIVASVK